jgi:hypothetical protein
VPLVLTAPSGRVAQRLAAASVSAAGLCRHGATPWTDRSARGDRPEYPYFRDAQSLVACNRGADAEKPPLELDPWATRRTSPLVADGAQGPRT